MAEYEVTVTVTYAFDVEAENVEEAEKQGYNYEDYPFSAIVDSIEVYEYATNEEESEDE